MRPRSEQGFVLTEVLVVLSISLVLLSASLLTFERMVTGSNESEKRQDTVETARRALDTEARQLRNLAKRLNNAEVIAITQPYDFVFQTSDPSRTWVRYCLNTDLGTDRGRVFEQHQSVPVGGAGNPITAAMTSTCPSSSGWTHTSAVATDVTNRIGGRERPLFQYRCVDGTSSTAGNATCMTGATIDQIVGVEAALFVNTKPNEMLEELPVHSSVYLRNQNQAPVARASATPVGPRKILLNASASSDYENRTLQFFWFLNTMPTSIDCHAAVESNISSGTFWGGNLIGRGISYTHTFPATDGPSGTNHTIGMVACDPGDRYDELNPNLTVQIP